MAKAFNQKIKILYLIQMLMQNTDSEHVMNMQEIIGWLDEKGIKSERKSIYDDFDTIRQFGIHVRFKKSTPSGYFIETRDLDLPEVQMIANAIRGCSQIEPEKADALIEKLGNSLSIHQMEELKAFLAAPKEEKEPEMPVDASEEPVTVPAETPEEIGAAPEVQTEVSAVEESVTPKVCDESSPDMEEIQLLFKEKHMDTIKARFGDEIVIKQHKETIYKTKVMTEVNPQFFGWVSSFGMGIKIVKPKTVAERYRIYLKKLLKQYK